MPELPQLPLLVLLGVGLAVIVLLAAALARARGQIRSLRRRMAEQEATARKQPELEPQDKLGSWIAHDFLLFMRPIHGPIKQREIPWMLAELIAGTFEPEGIVILIRRKPALSDADKENQLVVALAEGTRVRRGGVIALGEGDLGYVAQTRRAMDRHELDRTASAGGDAGALAGFHPDLAVPMAVAGKTLGVVGIGRPRRSHARAKELLDLIAHTAALAIDNSTVLHKIRTAASADPLTGIYNKGALAHLLDEQIESARGNGSELAILLFDLDHLKSYNDRNGHVPGDELLRLLTSLVSDEVRSDDVLHRQKHGEAL